MGISCTDVEEWSVQLAFDGIYFTVAGHYAFAEGLYTYLTE